MIPILLLAAGQSSRMHGRDKLLEEIDDTPILSLLSARAIKVGPVFVTLPDLNHPRRKALPRGATVVPVADAANGMSHSLKAGVSALPDTATGVIILPTDMPDITTDDLITIKTHSQQNLIPIVRATTSDGKPGHPIYFARSLFTLLQNLSGDRGAYQICQDYSAQTKFVPLKGQRARLDLDTPEEWESYRTKRNL